MVTDALHVAVACGAVSRRAEGVDSKENGNMDGMVCEQIIVYTVHQTEATASVVVVAATASAASVTSASAQE